MPTYIHIGIFVLINTVLIVWGYWLVKRRAVAVSWLLLVAEVISIHFIFLSEPPIIRMLAIIATTFAAMKVIAAAKDYENRQTTLSFKQWLVFATGWAGMRAQPFESFGNKALPGGWQMVTFGFSRIVAGLALLSAVHMMSSLHINPSITYFIQSALSLVGLSFILHFGLLSISAGIWRFCGVNTYYLFRQPARSLSLAEFWSKRWNLAFSEMTAIAVFRPLKSKTGPAMALMLAFIFSGLLHELALSVPVNSGYGLPMLYFVIHGCLVLFEKLLSDHHITFLKNKLIARLWVFFWLVAPMQLLFHPQFIKQIVFSLAGLKLP